MLPMCLLTARSVMARVAAMVVLSGALERVWSSRAEAGYVAHRGAESGG
jgi:hypothetical protein